MAKGSSKRGVRVTRNPELVPGVRRYGRVANAQRRRKDLHAKKGLGKDAAHVTPVHQDRMEGKYYAADDTSVPLRSHRPKGPRPTKLRKSIQPGSVLILLAGRFRGKRVVFLKQLASGMLLVTGPYKINGVPLRRVNQSYVIATSATVDVSKVDVAKIDDKFFDVKKEKKAASKDGEAFFDKEKKKSPVSAERKAETARVGASVLAAVKAVPSMAEYLNAKFSLTRGQRPHMMKF